MTTTNLPAKNSSAFFFQAAIAFAVSTTGGLVGIAYLPIDAWQRSFLAMTLLFIVTSAFTLAKVIRDQQENQQVFSRVDAARLEKMLAEYDPFAIPSLNTAPQTFHPQNQ